MGTFSSTSHFERGIAVRSRIGFLLRLTALKFMAFLTFIALALYTPSTANLLLGGAGNASRAIAQGTESALQSIGAMLGDVNALMPKKGAVELLLHVFGLDKVIVFIGLTIALYVVWLLVIATGRGALRRLDASGTPRKQETARLQSGPPR
jgi:hypothetical protein